MLHCQRMDRVSSTCDILFERDKTRSLQGRQELMVPHADVPDIRWIDWHRLAEAGFKGCVFDKDNTLTKPYELLLHPDVADSLAECRQAFGENMVLFSNSAGLESYDKDFEEAARVETALGVPVLRHRDKKPSGGTAEIEKAFGCAAHEVVMVGDRYLTDVVFGNLNGMLTVRVAPFTTAGESFGVGVSRGVEGNVLRWLQRWGVAHPVQKVLEARGARASIAVKDPGVW